MEPLQLRFLGGLEIYQDGRPVHSRLAQKSAALTCYLAMTGQAQRRSVLASLLWSDFPQERARGNLRDTLSRLRRSPLSPYIETTRQSISFGEQLPHWVDTVAFEKSLPQGRAGQPAKPEALFTACDLYQGDFLAGFELARAPLFEEWMTVQRQRLHLLAIEALHQLVAHHLETRQYAAGINYAHRLLALDPWREGTHYSLMKLLWLEGDISAALKQFHECRQVLADELGVAPSAKTQALFESIRQQAAAPPPADGQRPAGSQLGQPVVVPHNLPAQSTPFVGREAERQQLDRLMADPTNRLITIWGLGGMGKTRLALAAAEQQRQASRPDGSPRFPHGVFLVHLQGLEAAADLIPALLQTVPGLSAVGAAEVPEWKQLIEILGEKQILLILDNFEHLLEAALSLPRLLQACPNVQLLVTSRSQLRLYEEQLVPLQGLPYPESDTRLAAAEARQYAAVQLFLERVRRIRPEYQVEDDQLPHVLAVCRRVQGIPLALELAAGLAAQLTLASIASQLQQDWTILATDRRNVPSRHRSMERLFDSAWGRLSATNQEILLCLALFQGGFTAEAGLAVAQAGRPSLLKLVAGSLLLFDLASQRFHMHRLLQQYALEKIARRPAARLKHLDRHARYFCQAAGRWGDELKGAGHNQALARLQADWDNVRSAWRWALQQRDVALLAQAVEGICFYCETRGLYQMGADTCQQLDRSLAGRDVPGGASAFRLRLTVLAWQVNFRRLLGQETATQRLLQEAMTLQQRPTLQGEDLRQEEAFLLQQQGNLLVRDGRWEEARRCFQRSVTRYQALGATWAEARSWQLLGRVEFRQADYDAARLAYQRSLALLQRCGDQSGEVRALAGLAYVDSYLGDHPAAEKSQRYAIHMLRQSGDLDGLGHRLRELALTLMLSGRFQEALAEAKKSLDAHQELGARRRISSSMLVVGMAEMHLGHLDRARQVLAEALEMVADTAAILPAASQLVMLANISFMAGDVDKGYQQAAAGVARLRAGGLKWELTWALVSLALGHRALAQERQAWLCLRESLQIGLEIRALLGIRLALSMAALLRLDAAPPGRQRLVEAAELLAMAEQSPILRQSCWFEAVIAGPLKQATAQLTPELLAKANDAGRRGDPWPTAEALLADLSQR